jgi:long-chain acyl-CoA synthetase
VTARETDFRLPGLIRTQAAQHPEQVALSCGERTVTYAALDERSSRAARGMAAAGMSAGSRAVHIDKNSPEFFDLLFGAAKIGAVAVPVNWRLTPAEIAAVVGDARAELVVLGPAFTALRAETEAACSARVLVAGEDYEAWLAEQDTSDPGYRGEASDVVMQLYTSGTTGAAKGVEVSNANLGALQEVGPRWDVDSSAVCLVATPLFHIGGSGWALVGLQCGGRDVLIPEIDPPALLDTMERERVTHGFLVPAILALLTSVPGAGERDYSALRSLTYGASPITTPVLRRALECFGVPLFQVYGLTETTGAITQLDPEDHDPGGAREYLMRSGGKPYPWVEIITVDPDGEKRLGAGEIGEVWIRSSQVTPGYWHRPEETAATITPEGWLRTGDAGYLDEAGYLFLTDRIKDMIVTGAENVYPIEIENVLAGHPGVADVAVIGVPSTQWGEAVKAVVVRAPGAEAGEAELLDYARERLAGFKRPRSVDFTDALPRNPTGKVLKRAIRAPYWEDAEGCFVG